MVSFVCSSCQATLKKAKVRAHLARCRGPVSCLDCSVDFAGDAYERHTSCVSEAEKYQGKLYKGDGKKQKRPRDGADGGGKAAKKPKPRSVQDRAVDAWRAELAEAGDGAAVSLRKARKSVAKRVKKDGGDAPASKEELRLDVLMALARLPVTVALLQSDA